MPSAISIVGVAPENNADTLAQKYMDRMDGAEMAVRLPWRRLNRAIGNGLDGGEVSLIYGAGGASKSFMVMNALLAAGNDKRAWKLLPLEDTAEKAVERFIAIKENDWRMLARPENPDDIDERGELYEYKHATLAVHTVLVSKLFADHVCENPWKLIADNGGSFTHWDIVDFVGENAGLVDVIAIDNLTQIPFGDNQRDEFKNQADFMRGILAAVAGTRCHVLLVAHTKKGYRQMAVDDADSMAGSSAFSKLAHNVIAITRHNPPVESDIVSNMPWTAAHNLTVTVSKSRNGMSGTRLAFDLSKSGPTFDELGIIKLKAHR